MMINRLLKIFNKNRNCPREGFFWIINDEVIGFANNAPQKSYEHSFKDKTHENTWSTFKSDYKVNGEEVPFDYYPRGRVIVDTNYDSNNNLYYSVLVLIDSCIINDKYKNMILDCYNLRFKTCDIIWIHSLENREGIDYYTCHKCRNN